jgi:hypothetical protein
MKKIVVHLLHKFNKNHVANFPNSFFPTRSRHIFNFFNGVPKIKAVRAVLLWDVYSDLASWHRKSSGDIVTSPRAERRKNQGPIYSEGRKKLYSS